MLVGTHKLKTSRLLYHSFVTTKALRRVIKASCRSYFLLLRSHWWGVWWWRHPTFEAITWKLPVANTRKKQEPWVKLVGAVDPLEEEALLMVLEKQTNKSCKALVQP
jgi:hypothetical protein